MIQGCQLFPWISNHRANETGQSNFLDCQTCTANEEERGWLSCGWIPERDRSSDPPPMPAGYPHDPPVVCPGYLVSLPQVIEAARAASWRQDGDLALFYNHECIGPLTKTAIDLIASNNKQSQNYNIKKAHED